jgi:hypothetical protein
LHGRNIDEIDQLEVFDYRSRDDGSKMSVSVQGTPPAE